MTWSPENGSLDFATLSAAYRAGETTPTAVAAAVLDRIAAAGTGPEWTELLPRSRVLAIAAEAERSGPGPDRPLLGLPFGVKDNFDLAGCRTTHGVRGIGAAAERDHPVVAMLVAAGAVPLGKNAMDQFGVGLNGQRTTYPAPSCAFDPLFISGGSSSGGGVCVARGHASFALGGDAAGSGRVPAALNNVVGLKATPHLVTDGGPSPAGMTATHSILALTVEDAAAATRAILGHDPADPFSRPDADGFDLSLDLSPTPFRFGVPTGDSLVFDGDREAGRLFGEAAERLAAIGGEPVPVDIGYLLDAARMLYEDAFIAQRYANTGAFVEAHADAVHPATRRIVLWGRDYTGADVSRAQYRIGAARQRARALFREIDVLATPTTPTTYTVARMTASVDENVRLNAMLGTYTNFNNLLHLCALAVPMGFRADGKPLGLMLNGPEAGDRRTASIAARYQRASGLPLGATGHPHPAAAAA